MSNKCESWVWENSDTRGNDRIVLVYIADQADDDGTGAYPGIDRIARRANLPKRTVMRCLERLEASGALIINRPQQRGRGHFNTYVVVMDRGESAGQKGDTLTPLPGPLSGAQTDQEKVPQRRAKARKGARPYLNGSRSIDPLTHTPSLNARATNDQPPAATPRAGSEVPHPGTADRGEELLVLLAKAVPPAHHHELLHDPGQDLGRSALRRRLVALEAMVGADAALSIVAGEWPTSVASAMAHCNARAKAHLEPGHGRGSTTGARPADPLDGIAAAAAALAERARAREAELAEEPRLVSLPDCSDLRMILHRAPADADAPGAP